MVTKQRPFIYGWKIAPFVRLLIPFIAGITLEWSDQIGIAFIILGLFSFAAIYFFWQFFPLSIKYKLQPIAGISLSLLIMFAGLASTWEKDIRNNSNWFGNFYRDSDLLLVKINEPPTEKPKSWKAEGTVLSIVQNKKEISCEGKLILYFSKDSTQHLHYGDLILVNKKLQPIRNSGNPGAFDYERYAAFQQIFHNVFLKSSDFIILPEKQPGYFYQFIFFLQRNILSTLQSNIKGADELGIAEALLIGYKEDLDKDLVQAYSNTGVVHIIAISGLHIGLIYVMLVWIFNRIPFIRKSKLLKLLLILICLWLFTFLTGASASVLRSAVMFTFIVLGQNLSTDKGGKKTSIYNSLAVSATLLLIYNPFFLWDVGFQLSYLAVVGIVAFQKPVYNWFYVKNKWLDKLWQMAAVSLAAQVFTFPICIYYFHQFPNYFLITNIIAVPLSSLILFAEIFLIAFSWINFAGIWIGKITTALLWLMNKIILTVNALPFALFDRLPISVIETWLLYAIIISCAYWLILKNKSFLKAFLFSLLCFLLVKAVNQWSAASQQKLVVYNLAQQQAMDLIEGTGYQFIGDSILESNPQLQNFSLKPARISLRLNHKIKTSANVAGQHNFFFFVGKRIFIDDKQLAFSSPTGKIDVDIIVLSKNVKTSVTALTNVFNCNQYVFDGSNSLWKIAKWKKECEALHLRCHAVSEQGAFILDIGR